MSMLFPESVRKDLSLYNRKFKSFNEENCKNWFKKKGNKDKYRDLGFIVKKKDTVFIFDMGVDNIAYAEVVDENNFNWESSIKFNRQNLKNNNEDKNLFTLINDLKYLNKL